MSWARKLQRRDPSGGVWLLELGLLIGLLVALLSGLGFMSDRCEAKGGKLMRDLAGFYRCVDGAPK